MLEFGSAPTLTAGGVWLQPEVTCALQVAPSMIEMARSPASSTKIVCVLASTTATSGAKPVAACATGVQFEVVAALQVAASITAIVVPGGPSWAPPCGT